MTDTLFLVMVIAIMAGATFLTRGFSFWFLRRKQDSPMLTFVGASLPLMVMPLLVIYALKDISLTIPPYGFPELSAALLVAVVHLWQRNALLSIAAGTVLYIYFQSFGAV